jgi:hypothetical protein
MNKNHPADERIAAMQSFSFGVWTARRSRSRYREYPEAAPTTSDSGVPEVVQKQVGSENRLSLGLGGRTGYRTSHSVTSWVNDNTDP